MWRLLVAMMVGTAIFSAPCLAQDKGKGGDDAKKITSEIEKLKGQIKDLEAKLKTTKESGAKTEKRPGGKKGSEVRARGGKGGKGCKRGAAVGFEGRGKGKGFEGRGFPGKGKGVADRGFPGKGKGVAGKGFPGGAGKGFERGKEAKRPESSTATSDVERRLDRLMRELEEIRREIRKK